MIYGDDLVAGTVYELGTHQVSEEEIVEFGRRYDPFPFHVDADAARETVFGGLIASGLHSMALFQSLAVPGALGGWAVIAGRSISDVQFSAPVRPGMTLRAQLEITGIEHRGPRRTVVSMDCRLHHEDDVVLSFHGTTYVHRRPVEG